MDPIYMALGMQAMNLLQQAYASASGQIADGALAKAGETLFDFLQRKLTKPAQAEALDEFKKIPSDTLNQTALLAQVQKALRDDEAFQKELEQLLKTTKASLSNQTIRDVFGDGNIIVQAHGSHVSITR